MPTSRRHATISRPRNSPRRRCLTIRRPTTSRRSIFPTRRFRCAATWRSGSPAGSGTGYSARSMPPFARRARAAGASCCTTGRRTRTRRSISAPRSTRYSRTSSSRAGRSPASTRPTSPGGTVTACRSRCRSKKPTASTCRPRRRSAFAAPTRASKSRCRWPTFSAWAFWATGIITTRRWAITTRPTRFGSSDGCWRKAISIAA